MLDVGREDPVSQLTDSWSELVGSVRGIARFRKSPGLAGSDALASPTPVDPSVKSEGVAGVECSAVYAKTNDCVRVGWGYTSGIRRSAWYAQARGRCAWPGRARSTAIGVWSSTGGRWGAAAGNGLGCRLVDGRVMEGLQWGTEIYRGAGPVLSAAQVGQIERQVR